MPPLPAVLRVLESLFAPPPPPPHTATLIRVTPAGTVHVYVPGVVHDFSVYGGILALVVAELS